MLEPVTVPVVVIEFAIEYDNPDFLLNYGHAVQCLYDGLRPWNPRLDEMEISNTGKLSEQGVNVKLSHKRVSMFVGFASFKFTREDASSDTNSETVEILDRATSLLMRDRPVAAKKATLLMHVQLGDSHFTEILRPLLAPTLLKMEPGPEHTMAAVVRWKDRKVTIDGSVLFANAVFLKLEREFPNTSSWDEMIDRLQRDKREVFGVLGVEEYRE